MKTGGTVIIVDLTSSEDAASADEMNRLERLRDPTHTRALSPSGLSDMLTQAGLRALHTHDSEGDQLPTLPVYMDLEGWMQATNTPPAGRW